MFNDFDVLHHRLTNRQLRAVCELAGRDSAFKIRLLEDLAPILREFDEQDERCEQARQLSIQESVIYCRAIRLRSKETGRDYGSDAELESFKARVR